jgi:hypothetical protein
MALSPNYGWAEPDNSSLVKNGAQDIRALGDAIDTSLWNVGFGQAGKNAIINGNFGIWQRGTSFTPASGSGIYSADRFNLSWSGTGTSTFSQQTFTPGAAPVAGYEAQFYLRCAMSSGATYVQVNQPIEDVRTFAGQTITISYWAKASSSVVIRPIYRQNFGSGGSGNVDASGVVDKTLTSSWVRYTDTVTMPSITGKTIGTGSALQIYFINYQSGTIASNTIEVWGLQVEYGSKATPFETATGTIQGELALCQRYYQKSFAQSTAPATNAGRNSSFENYAIQAAGAFGLSFVRLPIVMRVAPTVTIFNPSAANNQARNFSLSSDCSGTTVEGQTDTAFRYYYTLPASSVSTNVIISHYEATAEL